MEKDLTKDFNKLGQKCTKLYQEMNTIYLDHLSMALLNYIVEDRETGKTNWDNVGNLMILQSDLNRLSYICNYIENEIQRIIDNNIQENK